MVTRDVLCESTHTVWHGQTDLPGGTDLVILPGGFSYGDALRSGALARFSPIMPAVVAHAHRGGFVLGICNGFQILLETKLLPGAMLQNVSRKFVCRTAAIEVTSAASPFTCTLEEGQILELPIAHHEGCYFATDEDIAMLRDQDRIILRYAGVNPNGSVQNIAGVTNEKRNVLGLMPHPERAADPGLGFSDGLGFFRSIRQAMNGEVCR